MSTKLTNKSPIVSKMNKIVVLILLSFVPLMNVFSQTKLNSFKITGNVSGFSDGTMIYLDGLDSTFIVNGKFSFAGSMDTKEKHVILHTKGYTDYKMLWIESSVTQFRAKKGNFRKAEITGSGIQTTMDSLQEKIDRLGNERNQYGNFIKNNPASILSIYLLDVYAATWGKDTTAMLFKQMTPRLKSTPYGINVSKFIALNRNIKVGDKYADITQPNIDGKMIRLSDFENKVILLEFWGSWCAPCRKGHPELIRIYNKYKNSGFEILGIAADSDKAQWLSAIKEDKLPWENITDLKGNKNEAALIYGISHYPTNFLVKDSVVIAIDLRGEALENKLSELLK